MYLTTLALLLACAPKDDQTNDTEPALYPEITIETSVVDLGAVKYPNVVYNMSITIENTGDEVLTVSEVLIPESRVFDSLEYAFQILPEFSKDLTLTFYPPDYGVYEEIITFVSDDPDTPEIEVVLRAEVVAPGE